MAGSAICRALQRAGYGDPTAGRGPAHRHPLRARSARSTCRAALVSRAPAHGGGAGGRQGGRHRRQQHLSSRFPARQPQDPDPRDRNRLALSGVRRLLFLGSSCIYPKFAAQPIREEALLTGPLEPTNEWYAIAKIAGIKLCEALRRQHGFDAISLMPTNLYGPGDNYHPTNSHVLPALIRRFHEAAQQPEHGAETAVTCWGTGTPLREFLHADDLGEACVFALEHWDPGSPDAPRACGPDGEDLGPLSFLNVGTGVDLSIAQLASAIAQACGYTGSIHWDSSKPDGTPKKQLDVSRLAKLGWRARISLEQGLRDTVAEYPARAAERLAV
jgi:GDP-L-fucose synthase